MVRRISPNLLDLQEVTNSFATLRTTGLEIFPCSLFVIKSLVTLSFSCRYANLRISFRRECMFPYLTKKHVRKIEDIEYIHCTG